MRSSGGPLPRVREKPPRREGGRSRRRSTPARAGKTRFGSGALAPVTVHSRACGKNGSRVSPELRSMGPLPRVREKPDTEQRRLYDTGSTPARAGKTAENRWWLPVGWVHSRACGKNAQLGGTTAADVGPLPRVREKRRRQLGEDTPNRSTPARAGKTINRQTLYSPPRVHSRACGKNLPAPCGGGFGAWSTPARAGKTSSCSTQAGGPQVHSRACGKNHHRVSVIHLA